MSGIAQPGGLNSIRQAETQEFVLIRTADGGDVRFVAWTQLGSRLPFFDLCPQSIQHDLVA